ncbi:MAG: type II secretion system protein [Pseudomonadota bacterium]
MTPRAEPTSQKGFSLIELIVTLAIMGIALSVSGPPIVRLVEAANFRDSVDSLARDFETLRVRAYLDGVDLAFDPESAASGPSSVARDLAAKGWTFSGEPIFAGSVGVCSGGPVTASAPQGRIATIAVNTPDCTRKE